jgi:hypothetical protein
MAHNLYNLTLQVCNRLFPSSSNSTNGTRDMDVELGNTLVIPWLLLLIYHYLFYCVDNRAGEIHAQSVHTTKDTLPEVHTNIYCHRNMDIYMYSTYSFPFNSLERYGDK